MKIKTMKEIATSRVIRSSRAIPSLSRISAESLDRARISAEIGRIEFHQTRRRWLNQSHLKRSPLS